MRWRQNQRGSALLVVLILVASLSVVALAIVSHTERAANRVLAAQAQDRAYWAMIGAERAALVLLDAQAQQREGVDLPSERWLSAPFTLAFEGATVSATFRDASACFNIHDLVDGAEGNLAADEGAIRRFGALVADLGGDAQGGEVLATAAADFMDTDGDAGPGGAEDYSYSRGDAPYLTASGLLADPTELRAVEGWTAGVTDALRPWICTRTAEVDSGAINLNTLVEADAPLLANALDNLIPVGEAERLIANRPPDGYDSVEQFLELPTFSNLDPDALSNVAARLGTEATLIEFRAAIRYDGLAFEFTSLIEKGTGAGYGVTSRRLGPEN